MNIINMIYKDLKIFLSDKKALIITLFMPLILIMILSFALKGTFSGDGLSEAINVAIVKEYNLEQEQIKFRKYINNNMLIDEKGKKSMIEVIDDINAEKMFFNDFLSDEQLRKIMNYEVMSEDKALDSLKKKEVSCIIYLPKDFIYSTMINFSTPMRNKIQIKVDGHPDYPYSTGIVTEIIKSYTDVISLSIINKNVITNNVGEYVDISQIYSQFNDVMDTLSNNINIDSISLNKIKIEGFKVVDSFTYYTVAMMTMFILFSAGIVARSLLIEDENRTYDRIIVFGGNNIQFLLSKFFVIMCLCIIQILIIVIVSKTLFGVSWSNPFSTALISIVAAFATGGLGSLIGSIALITKNYKLTSLFESLIIQIMSLFGGNFIPIQVLPSYFQGLSKWTINGLALEAYLKIFQGGNISNIKINLLRLLIIGVSTLIIGILFINKQGVRLNAKFTNS